jgi:hypothetical protein
MNNFTAALYFGLKGKASGGKQYAALRCRTSFSGDCPLVAKNCSGFWPVNAK